MSYSVFSTMTVAGAVAEATLVAQNRDRAARKAAKAQNKSLRHALLGWAKPATGGCLDADNGCGRAA